MNTHSTEALCHDLGIGWHQADDAQLLADDLARYIAEQLQLEIDAHGAASLVVSGGSTPAPVFSRLSQLPVDWSLVSVTLADERWVPITHADSNESLVRNTLLVNKAAVASFVPLYRDDVAPEDALEDVAEGITSMRQPFSVTILGMGGDGHTASLFPDAPAEQLSAAMSLTSDQSVAILNPPSVDQVRISLTRTALLRSKKRIIHITGNGKLQVLDDALRESGAREDGVGEYTQGMKPVIGLLTSQPKAACVYWSP